VGLIVQAIVEQLRLEAGSPCDKPPALGLRACSTTFKQAIIASEIVQILGHHLTS